MKYVSTTINNTLSTSKNRVVLVGDKKQSDGPTFEGMFIFDHDRDSRRISFAPPYIFEVVIFFINSLASTYEKSEQL
jgi:hypothetical protein